MNVNNKYHLDQLIEISSNLSESKKTDSLDVPFVDFPSQFAEERDSIHDCVDLVFSEGQFVSEKKIEEFETLVAKQVGTSFAVGVSSGTDALYLGLKSLNVGEGDEVITPPNSHFSSTSAIVQTGATPVFVDVLDDQNIDPDAVKAAITKQTKVIMPVHLTGRVARMDEIIKIAKRNGIEVPFLRPKNLARDNSKEIYVWKHALKYLKKINKFPDILVVLPVTSPLRKKKHIYQAINKFQKDKSDALITIKEPENNPYFNMIRLNKKDHAQIIINKKKFSRRQDAPKVYSMSTICFVLKPSFILKTKNIFNGKVSTALFDKKYSVDIDNNFDFIIAETLFNKNKPI